MPRKGKQGREQSPITFKASDITRRQIADLAELWGENQSQVIKRAIANAHLLALSQMGGSRKRGEA